uniref:HotDog ACOT-type domain-containing protein n=1 Tax=Setaria digitata TaxID=48799 RepID=A0A915Q0J8_9BILA
MTLTSIRPIIRRCFTTGPKRTIVDVQQALERHISIIRKNESSTNRPKKFQHRTMGDSRDQILIPLSLKSSNAQFHIKYTSWRNNVRFGMLLEDLDTFAVWLAYRHNQGEIPSQNLENLEPVTFVTACVDHIRMDDQYDIVLDEDIHMDGFVSWVGRSSLEVSMQLTQNSNGVMNKFLQTKFVIVARDLAGKRSLTNVPLITTNAEEEAIFIQGKEGQQLRKLNEECSLLKTPPNEAEIKILHDIFKKTVQSGGHKVQNRILPPDHVWIHDAGLSNTVVCFPVKRNIYGKIFGGFLMRKAVELAWSNASLFSGNRCRICGVDDIMFRKSVDIGAILLLSSQVCYTDSRYMELIVDAEVLDVVSGNRELTNTFYLTFQSDRIVPTVIPYSYSEPESGCDSGPPVSQRGGERLCSVIDCFYHLLHFAFKISNKCIMVVSLDSDAPSLNDMHSPDDKGILKRMYEKFMKNPVIPVLACTALYAAFCMSRRRFIKSMSQAEFNRSVALAPFAAFAGTAVWFHGTSIRDRQYIPQDD